MNVLAEEQKKLFEKGITKEELEEREKRFLELYYRLRTKDEGKFWSKLSLEQRQKIHGIILTIYKLKNRLGGFRYNLIKDEREETDRPIIFAITHVGKFDIEVVSEAIKDHYYLLSGDYEHIQGIIDAPFIGLNGVIYFNETDQIDKLFTISIGKNFDMNNYGDTTEEKTRAINDLRDTLATLKWEIWESYGMKKREDILDDEWDRYVAARFKEWPYFNEEYIEGLIFKPKNVVTHDEVYAPVKKLVPNKNNAFLFNKRLKDNIFR